MRNFILLTLLVGCAQTQILKHRYNFSKKYLSSLTSEDTQVKKIEIELKEPRVFASGMDSTYIQVRLFGADGEVLTDVDPRDLSLSTNVEIETEPFTQKKDYYRAEIQPHFKSADIILRVDWLEQVLSKDVTLKAGVEPVRDQLTPVRHDYWKTKPRDEISVSHGSSTPGRLTERFSLENMGSNKIVRKGNRTFTFSYLEQARQNISLTVDDAPDETISHTMHSLFMFFPRKQLPTVEQKGETVDVTLPTGEKISFKKSSKELVGGVMKENPLEKSKFADLRYLGKGVVLRANAKGRSPELGQYGSEKIDQEFGSKGSGDVLLINASTGQRCVRPKADFWEQKDVSPIQFKFVHDDSLDEYLKANCGFHLPKL